MEFRSLSFDPEIPADRRNAMRTYLALACHAPDAKIVSRPTWVTSSVPNLETLGNFAVGWRWKRAEVAEAIEGRDPDGFLLYEMDGDRTDIPAEDLIFSFSLDCLTAPPLASNGAEVLHEAVTEAERTAVSRFMAENFFGAQSHKRRRALARLTAECPEFRLYFLTERNMTIAAAMVQESDGFAGVFNVCTAQEHRQRGLGANLVQAIRRLYSCPTCLQCDSGLAPWYKKLGFVSSGSLIAYRLPWRDDIV